MKDVPFLQNIALYEVKIKRSWSRSSLYRSHDVVMGEELFLYAETQKSDEM